MTAPLAARRKVVAELRVHDEPVAQVEAAPGERLVVGPGGDLDVPAPEGAPYLLEVTWNGPHELVVADGQARLHRLGPDDALRLRVGAVQVDLGLVERFALRRTHPFSAAGSLPWALTVVMLALLTAQADLVVAHLCPWFGIACPVTREADNRAVNAEYIARLLRKDFAGDAEGVVEMKAPEHPRELGVQEYVPAGQFEGDRTSLEGGADPSGEVERTGRQEDELARREREAAPPPQATSEAEEEVVALPPPTPPEEPVEGAPEGPDEGGLEEAPAASEAKEGWGLQDWLEASPQEREIRMGLETARRKLAIDPENVGALSVLAYYQYLGEDLDGALATYDRLLALRPEDAAAWNNKALVLKRRGEYAKEELLYRTALALEPDDTTAMNNLAVNLAHQGRFEEALAIMRELEVLLPGDAYSDLHRAKIHAQMGELDKALAYLDKALANLDDLDLMHHTEFRQDIRLDPSFQPLRADPRFRAILQEHYGDEAPR